MRLQRLRINDVVAGLLVAGAVGIYAAGVAGASPIGMSDVRARAAAIFVIGITACAVGARPDAFREDAPTGRFVSVLTALGLGATVVGLVAIVLAST
ncbi:MAG TPA: hypothetical protein VFA96_03550, partial [Nocardioides sp.]|nr:hypothetical protein [Nocardioides sp.]